MIFGKIINVQNNYMRCILILLFFIPCSYSFSQKVAVVLSGGGAKGLAHAGVLKALEENDIPIDFIVGTSMGALAGAFYAAGYSSEEIVELAVSSELQDWIENKPKKEYQHLQKRGSPDPSWVSLKLSIDSSFSATFRTSLAHDYMLNFALAERFAPSSELSQSNFDQLFVPYRATASEIFTEKAVVLKSGNLFEAARASMAVPFFYRPIRVNDELMFDGGIYDNFPVGVARSEFNPDAIIGVNVATKKLNEYPHGKDQNLIAESVLFAILDKADSSELSEKDIFIDVDLENYNALNFKEANAIVALGYSATMKKMDEIKRKITRRENRKSLVQKREKFKGGFKEILFENLNVQGFSNHQKNYILGQFDTKRPASFNLLENGYNKIVADDYFSNIIPSYSFDEKNIFMLSGNANPKLKGKIGGTLVSRNMSQLYLGFDFKRLRRSLTHYSLGIYTGRFYQSININTKTHFSGKLGVSITPSFIYNRWNFISTPDLFSRDKNPEIQDRRDSGYGVNISFPMFRNMLFDFTGSYFFNQDQFSNDTVLNSSDDLDVLELSGAKFQLSFSTNSLNFSQYAYRGKRFKAYANMYMASENYEAGNTSQISSFSEKKHNWYKIGIEWEKYFNWTDKYTFGMSFSGAYSNQPTFGTTRSSLLNQPAFNPLQDSQTIILTQLRGRKFVATGIKNVFHIANSLQFRIEGYSIFSAEELVGKEGFAGTYVQDHSWAFCGTTGVVYQSLIGPISLSLNYYDEAESNWGGLLHIGYFLFNNKSLD
jgi:NTE family protein